MGKKRREESLLPYYELDLLNHFEAHYILLKEGKNITAYVHLRIIYEHILKIYAIQTDKELAKKIFERDTAENKDTAKYEGSIINEIRQKLYSEQKKKGNSELYKIFSGYVHASLKSRSNLVKIGPACSENGHIDDEKPLLSSIETEPLQLDDNLFLGITLISANFVTLFEIYKCIIKEEHRKETLDLFRSISKSFSNNLPEISESYIDEAKKLIKKLEKQDTQTVTNEISSCLSEIENIQKRRKEILDLFRSISKSFSDNLPEIFESYIAKVEKLIKKLEKQDTQTVIKEISSCLSMIGTIEKQILQDLNYLRDASLVIPDNPDLTEKLRFKESVDFMKYLQN